MSDRRGVGWILRTALAVVASAALAGGVDEDGPIRLPWEYALEWLEGERGALARDLETAQEGLGARAKREQPELLERLQPQPSQTAGYGILPTLKPQIPLRSVPPSRQVYALEGLTTAFTGAFRDAAVLARRTADEPAAPLQPLVAELERLRKRLKLLDEHLSYHRFWQRDAARAPGAYTRRNRSLGLLEQWWAQGDEGGDPGRLEELRRQVLDGLAPFRPTPGLVIRPQADGTRLLTVPVLTDIADLRFLEELRSGMRAAFTDSPAARRHLRRVAREFERISPAALYGGAPPAPGASIRTAEHLRRFPEAVLILTTGAQRTHAAIGRHVLLGPDPMSRRALAHEFAHLLGFADAYVRAYTGNPGDRFGLVFIEWSGLSDDLMGAPGYGRVSEEMIGRVLEAYQPPAVEE